jgi:hypothetical protein
LPDPLDDWEIVMHRLFYRARARLASSVGSALVLVAGASGAYAGAIRLWSAAELPMITFTARGPAPLPCAAHPDVSSLTVRHGARIVLANVTGVDATVDTGRRNAGSHGSAWSVEASGAGVVFEAILDLQDGPAVDMYDVRPFFGDRPSQREGARLLAVIAAICVLGVTSAIIRAILAQRASGVVRT